MTLHLYIFRQLLLGTAFATGGMAFVAIPGMVINAVHKLGGVGMRAALGYLPLVFIELVPYLLPIGFLLTVVATYGRLAADNEWSAMNMAGFSPLRLSLPAIVVALGMGAGTYYLVSNFSPGMRYAKRNYIRTTFVEGLKRIAPGRTKLNFPGTQFYLSAHWREKDGDRAFRDVLIHVPSDAEEEDASEGQTIRADWLTIHFEDNVMVIRMREMRRMFGSQDTQVGEITLRRGMDQIFKIKNKSRTWRYQTSGRLREMLDNGEVPEDEVRAAQFEIHSRYATGMTCLLFVLLGIPTGLLLRSGTQLGALAAAVGYALLYYLLSMRMGRALGEGGIVPVWVGAWSTTFLGAVWGLILARRALFR